MGRLRGLAGSVSRGLGLSVLALLALLALTVVALWLVSRKPSLSFLQAVYVTLLDAVGGASVNLSLPGPEKLIEAVATLAGVAFVPVATAAIVQAVVNARLALALGARHEPVAGHVVVVGLGNLGTRVVQQLRDLGVPVVAIDKTETQIVPAVRWLIAANQLDEASRLGRELDNRLEAQARAYGRVVAAQVARARGRHIDAVDALREALTLADLWLVRFNLEWSKASIRVYPDELRRLPSRSRARRSAAHDFVS